MKAGLSLQTARPSTERECLIGIVSVHVVETGANQQRVLGALGRVHVL